MKDSSYWLDRANDHGVTDYRLHKISGESRQRVSAIRHGHQPMSPALASAIEEVLGEKTGVVFAYCAAARAKRTTEKHYWERVAKSIAAGFLIGVIGLGGPVGTLRTASAFTADIHYAQYRRGPRRPTRRFSWIFAQGGGGPVAMAA